MLEFEVIENLKPNNDLIGILKDFKYKIKLGKIKIILHTNLKVIIPNALATEYITQEKSDTRLTVSSDGTKISFEIFCAENQSLHVGLRINYPHKSNGVFYELTQWQTISSITEEPDTTLHLLGS